MSKNFTVAEYVISKDLEFISELKMSKEEYCEHEEEIIAIIERIKKYASSLEECLEESKKNYNNSHNYHHDCDYYYDYNGKDYDYQESMSDSYGQDY